jgi:hypothetical protein
LYTGTNVLAAILEISSLKVKQGGIMEKISLSQLRDRGYKVKYLDEPVRCECGFYGLAGQLIVNEDELDDEDTELRCPMCDKKAWQFD